MVGVQHLLTGFLVAFMRGDANKGSDAGDQSVVNEIETYATTTTNGYVDEKWTWVYKGVQRANMALKVLNNVQDLDPEIKNPDLEN